jgi:Lon-like protease
MTAGSRRYERLSVAGMAVLLILSVLGELAWLFDPLNLPGTMRWIDALNVLPYLAAAAPALWACGAWMRIADRTGRARLRWGSRPRSKLQGASSLLSLLLSAGTVLAIALLEMEPDRIVLTVALLAAAWLAVFIDLAAAEWQARRSFARTLLLLAANAGLFACLFWPTGSLVTYPGLTMDMNRYAAAEEGERQRQGRIDGVLIFERPAFPIDRLYAKLFPHYAFEPIEELGMSIGEYDELVRAMKQDANEAAIAIAYQRIGLGQGILAQGVRIRAIESGSPVSGVLHAGDIIVGMNGRKVLSLIDLTEVMDGVLPGEQLRLTVQRGGIELDVTAATRASEDEPERAVFGVLVENVLVPDAAGDVRFRSYAVHEGGPSHGAMLTLALLDQLTPGGVTGGRHIAGTGTIGPDGVIGRVGGVRQKAYTVSRTGAEVFFVPAGLEDEARRGAPDLLVVPVRTLDDVLNWLKTGE